MQYGTVSLILEIEKTKKHNTDRNRYHKALSDLVKSKIKGHKVIAVWAKDTDCCEVPHFGHNYVCREKCRNKPNVIIRYFGIDVIIDNISTDLFGVYELNKHSQITVSSMPVGVSSENRNELKLIKKL